MKMRKCILAFWPLSSPFVALPNTASGTDALRGFGLSRCNQFTRWETQDIQLNEMVSWLYGYWSAQNRLRRVEGLAMKNIMHSTVSPEPLLAQISAICAQNPDILIVFAADEIFERLPDAVE